MPAPARRHSTIITAAAVACLGLTAAACTKHEITADTRHEVKTEHHIKVDPIQINITVRIDRQLDEDLAFQEEFGLNDDLGS